MVTFAVYAVPIAQPRQRSAVVAGQVRTYTPAKHPVNIFKGQVVLDWRRTVGDMSPIDEPMWLRVLFALPRPKAKCRKKDGTSRLRHASKPDIDNLVKSLVDALTGLAWTDDRLISEVHATKVYAGVGEQPHVEVCYGVF